MFAFIARRGNLIVISILLSIFLTLITACGSTDTTSNPSVTSTQAITPTPTVNVSDPLSTAAANQVFTEMATAMKNKDYTTLYNLTSAEYQANHTQDQMLSDIQQFIYARIGDGAAITDFSFRTVAVGTRASDNAAVANGAMSFNFTNGHIDEIKDAIPSCGSSALCVLSSSICGASFF